jgi:hypothetical protein
MATLSSLLAVMSPDTARIACTALLSAKIGDTAAFYHVGMLLIVGYAATKVLDFPFRADSIARDIPGHAGSGQKERHALPMTSPTQVIAMRHWPFLFIASSWPSKFLPRIGRPSHGARALFPSEDKSMWTYTRRSTV